MARSKKILFVCTGNSAGSQIAEGFARAWGLQAASAGLEPSRVHPLARILPSSHLKFTQNLLPRPWFVI